MMHSARHLFSSLAVALFLVVGCNGIGDGGPEKEPLSEMPTNQGALSTDAFKTIEPAEPPTDTLGKTPQPEDARDRPQGFSGTVIETLATGTYTYILVEAGEKKIWVAAPRFEVVVGDAVDVPAGMVMKDFRSRSLQKTFDLIVFVDSVSTPSRAATVK